MEQFCKSQYAKLQSELEENTRSMASAIQKAEAAVAISKNHLNILKEFISNYKFNDTEERILFHKTYKPLFLLELLYYQRLFEIESNFPINNTESAISFYKKELSQINYYFDRHNFLHVYFQTGKTVFDPAMFGNTGERIPLFNEYDEGDGHFSNPFSYRLAKFHAYQNLTAYIANLVISLEKGEKAITPSEFDKLPKVFWRSSKASFYEVVLGMVEDGLITGNIQTAMEYLGFCLGIKPGNYWSYFQAMRIRTKDRTPVLKSMIKSVERRWDLQDEFPQQRK
ncbi:hypothetical protein HGH92_29655 [Chitinophaga varians]|uniref:RteC protein n=1 Tax=Chitinophaga varians TaxID=2202339 RepID=A0A847S6S3_9BACT|nr:RteC domain-containing protein [Chitinophaga varians]NLR68507.1 hypothetical protein [Chitinophaga varians]